MAWFPVLVYAVMPINPQKNCICALAAARKRRERWQNQYTSLQLAHVCTRVTGLQCIQCTDSVIMPRQVAPERLLPDRFHLQQISDFVLGVSSSSSSSTNFIATQVLKKTSRPLCVTCCTSVNATVAGGVRCRMIRLQCVLESLQWR